LEAFLGIQSLYSCISLLKWFGRIYLELVTSVEVPPIVGVEIVKDMNEAGLLILIAFLLDEDGPNFDFVKVSSSRIWVCFLLSFEVDQPSPMYLDALHDHCFLLLSSLMTVDLERQRLLALISDVDYECDASGCEFWIEVLICLGTWFLPEYVTEVKLAVEDDFDFQAYLIDADFDFDPVENL
jgi:hypothetical protein